MGYRITKFGSVDLPARHEAQDATTGEIQSSMVRLPGGGGYDAGGEDIAGEPGGYPLRVSGRKTAATAAALKTSMYALRALRGEYNQLYRTPDGGSANSEYVWARCLSVYSDRDWSQRLHEDVTLDFAVESQYWFGSLQAYSGTLLSSPGSVYATNSGDVDVTVGTFTVVVGGSALTRMQVRNQSGVYQSQIQYSGTVPASGTLIFDFAARSVNNNGTEDYGTRFQFLSLHEISDWWRMGTGLNVIRLEWTGGGTDTTYDLTYRHGWA